MRNKLVGIYKYFIQPNFLLIYWLLFLSYLPLSLLRYRYLNTYSNIFLQDNHLWESLLVVSLASGILFIAAFIFWIKESINQNDFEIHYWKMSLISWSALAFTLGGRYLLYINSKNFENYIYSTFGLIPGEIRLMTSISMIVIFMILFIVRPRHESSGAFSFLKIRMGFSLKKDSKIVLLIVGAFSIFLTLTMFLAPDADLLVLNSRSDYRGKFGSQFVYIEALVQGTPQDAWIVHPPRSTKWVAVGNQAVLRYFLFPRTLVSGALINKQEYVEGFREVYFVLVDPSGDNVWPKIFAPERQIVFDDKTRISYKKLEIVNVLNGISIYKLYF